MNDEKWGDTVAAIDEKFGISKRVKDTRTEIDDVGHEYPVKTDEVVFDGPLGTMRLRRTSRPQILDKKLHYNRASGEGAKVEYVFSPTEWSHKTELEKQNSTGDWEAVSGGL